MLDSFEAFLETLLEIVVVLIILLILAFIAEKLGVPVFEFFTQ